MVVVAVGVYWSDCVRVKVTVVEFWQRFVLVLLLHISGGGGRGTKGGGVLWS